MIAVRPILSPVTAAEAIKLLVIAVRPILSPVIAAATMLLALMDVRPYLSPVIVPERLATGIVPSVGTITDTRLLRYDTRILPEPDDGASVNVKVVLPFTVYEVNGSCCTLLTSTSISRVAYTIRAKVKVVVLPSPLKDSVNDVND